MPGCNGNCEILLRESNCMHSSSGIPLCHWWSQWRLGWIETRYLLSHARKNRQLPEIGFHFDVWGSVAYNCHCILLFNLFPFPFLSLYYSFSSLPFLSFSLLSLFCLAISFLCSFICLSLSQSLALWWNYAAESQSWWVWSFPLSLYCGYLEKTGPGSEAKDVGGQHCEKVFQLD